MSNIIFFDTETTGVNSTDFLCQLAYKINDETFYELYKPEIKIPAEASAVHHITNKMVENKISFQKSPDFKKIKNLFEDADSILVAHNAKFDLAIISFIAAVKASTAAPCFSKVCTSGMLIMP